jgi:NADH:ubiquinone oxidoreductase subunit 2 (subunit N)
MPSFFAQSVMPIINWALIAPEVIVCAAAVAAMLIDAFARPTQRWLTGSVSLAGLAAAAMAAIYLGTTGLTRLTPSTE